MITSTANAQVKNLVQLKKKSKERRRQQVYVVEGIRMFAEAPADRIEKIYVSASFAADSAHAELLREKTASPDSDGVRAELLRGRRVEVLAESVFDYVSDTKTPQGILCLIRMAEHAQEELFRSENGAWLVLENIQDPGNLGTMFRTGEGAGISGVIMDACTADIYNPKTIRSTMGSIYRVPFLITDDLPETLRRMKYGGITVCAAHPEGSVCYDEPDYTKRTAFLIGNEGNGLTRETASIADMNIRIPMQGQLESLNVAMAAGLLMYEADRQRRRGKSGSTSLGTAEK
ncbi:MAG: RNA methyltransferase [Lachnospiraceae bacterium]|nr:RNA methyltransferase [Lachnospiraceae bacterium]